MDNSNGYEGIATLFLKGRGQAVNGIGAPEVRSWVDISAIWCQPFR
jgi:hypothetical protein